ncbi:ankyrin repeat-containing domain protein [Xylaria flabelliformis]|nr:ankyrin repeat-containing domain protein [Xylaria flabelliformis]
MEASDHSNEGSDGYKSELSESSSPIEDSKDVRDGSTQDKNEEGDRGSSTGALPASDVIDRDNNRPEFGLREDPTDDAADYDVVLIHGIRDSCKAVWIHDNTCNWVKSHLLSYKKVNLLEFRYAIGDKAPIYSEGIEAEAIRFLEDLMEIHRNRPIRPLIFVARDLGGIIAQMALLMASRQASRYSIVSQLTNLIIFYNCPHRSPSILDAHDTMINLLNLAGYPRLTALSMKARRLADQVDLVNHGAVDAMLWLHIPMVNIISVPPSNESDSCSSAQDVQLNVSTYCLGKNSAMVQQPLERPYFTNLTHLELAQYKNDNPGMTSISAAIEDYIPKSTEHYFINHGDAGNLTWRYLLSECPPVRPPLPQNIHDEPLDDQFWAWIIGQEESLSWFDQQDVGTRILHVHGSSLMDVWSDKIYHGLDMLRPWQDTTVHFRFDGNDIRFDNLHGMISYLVIQLYRRLLFIGRASAAGAADTFLPFLNNSRSCSTTDLFQWLSILHHQYQITGVIYVVSCIDQCKDDIVGYLHQIRDIGKHTEFGFRILVTSNAKSEHMSQLEDYPSINIDHFVAHEQYSPDGLHQRNQRLLEELLVLDIGTKTLIKQIIDACGSDFQLSGMLLAWLVSVQGSQGLGPETIRILQNFTKPPSPLSACVAIRNSLPESLQETEKEVYIIVQTALHPLSIDQIAWALISDGFEEHLADPSQKQRDAAIKIRQLLPGLYELKHGEVHLCHDYWKSKNYDAVHDKASCHAMMARRCIGYLSIPPIRENLADLHRDDDKVCPAYFGNNLTAYSVKFLSLHYMLAGEKRPKKELFGFYEDENTRMIWYNVHFRLTSYLRHPLYSQSLPALPVVAQTGLSDLVAMFIESEKYKENFESDIAIALIEAARYGRNEVVDQLLEEVDERSGALKDAISSSASYGSIEPLYTLVSRCALIKQFEWPEDILHRTSWLGLTTVAEKLLEAGVTPNPAKEPQNYEGYLPLQLCMPGRHQHTATLLIQQGRADIGAKSSIGRSALVQAARYSNLDVVTLLLQRHVGYDSQDLHGALHYACYGGAFAAVQELLKNISTTEWESASEQKMVPLIFAINCGYFQCVEALTTHGINTNLSDGQTLPLISAVQSKRSELARLLLLHGANPNMTTEKFKLPLLAAVDNDDILMIKLLVEMGADVEMEDQTDTIMKTALSSAASFLNKEMLDYLLLMGANVNHIAVGSRSPLFAATWHGRIDNVRTLLRHGADPNAVVSDPIHWTPINAAYDNLVTLRALVEGGADINHCSRDGTVLFQASRWGFEATVEFLLEFRTDLDLDKELVDEEDGENNGMTPLCIACKYNHVGIMRLLLEAGANAQHKTRHGQFPLELCVESVPQGLPDQSLRQLLEYHPRINLSQRDDKGNTALHKIDTLTPLAITKLLVNAGADLNTANHKGYTALMVALEAGNIEVSRYLFSKAVSLSGTSNISPGLLHRAAFGANLDLIKMVIEAGADVNEIDPRTGETPLYTHLTGSPSIPIVQYLVDTCKADINLASGDLRYPIIQACSLSNLEIIRFLVEAGADVNVKDCAGRSPVHLFYYTGSNEVDILVDHGADLEATDKLGRTPLHYAAAVGDEKDVEELLKSSKIDVNQRDIDGWTPLMWACLQRKTWNLDYVADVLLARGADIWVRGKVEDEEWSPLKLARFHGGYGDWVLERLEPEDKNKPRFPHDADRRECWDDEFHQSKQGFEWKDYTCNGCFCRCWGVRWRCKEEHPGGYDLCFRCYPHRDILHPDHEHFEPSGEKFGPERQGTEPIEDDGWSEYDSWSEGAHSESN